MKEWLMTNGYQYKGHCHCPTNRYKIWRKGLVEFRIYKNGKYDALVKRDKVIAGALVVDFKNETLQHAGIL